MNLTAFLNALMPTLNDCLLWPVNHLPATPKTTKGACPQIKKELNPVFQELSSGFLRFSGQ